MPISERMDWSRLISARRLGQEMHSNMGRDDRSEFKRDYDRLIFSAPFRRLQNKTQVFPLPGSIFVHNRLTHSLEVASVGMSLGHDVAQWLIDDDPSLAQTLLPQIGTIVSTACLAHDMGNPPFGHSGEKAIQTFFSEGPGQALKGRISSSLWDDLTHFEGNANAFRILTHRFHGRREGGFVMTYTMLASVVKYPFASTAASKKGKFGFFYTEAETFRRIADELGMIRKSADGAPLVYARHPLVYLVEAADDICYEIMDIEDAHKLKLLSYEETENLLLRYFDDDRQQRIRRRMEEENLTDRNERVVYMRACAIGELERACAEAFIKNREEIMRGEFQGSLIKACREPVRTAYEQCADLSRVRIYNSKPVLDVELSGYKIMDTLMRVLVEAAVSPDKFHSQQIIRRVSSQYDIGASDLETRLMAVVDYISGMTDVFALDYYQKINGISLPII